MYMLELVIMIRSPKHLRLVDLQFCPVSSADCSHILGSNRVTNQSLVFRKHILQNRLQFLNRGFVSLATNHSGQQVLEITLWASVNEVAGYKVSQRPLEVYH